VGRETWFDVTSPGYEVPKDDFGYRGVRLKPELGKTLKVEVLRVIIPKRLGRLTGGGMFAEGQKTGRDLDWPESGILGCDSVQNAVHRGRLFWAFGDTTLPNYPLGIFHMKAPLVARDQRAHHVRVNAAVISLDILRQLEQRPVSNFC
jgi:hypothetical protein